MKQIFISYPEKDVRVVALFVRFLEANGYNVYFDPDKRRLGLQFRHRLRQEIERSYLHIIFISRNRNWKGVQNFEINCIEDASRDLRADIRIILIFLDLEQWEIPEHCEEWLLEYKSTYALYTKGKLQEVKKNLLASLKDWKHKLACYPTTIATEAEIKLKQDLTSKEHLAHWLSTKLPAQLKGHRSAFFGAGTTLDNAWRYSLRPAFLRDEMLTQLYTNNGFILHNEREIRKGGRASVHFQTTGNIYLEEYAAYHFTRPGNFPEVDFSLISISGIKLDTATFNLRLCWEELNGTMEQVFYKTRKEIMIVAAGRKLVEAEGAGNIKLYPMLQAPKTFRKRTLTIAVDTLVRRGKEKVFQEKVRLLSDMLKTDPEKSKSHPILIWKTKI